MGDYECFQCMCRFECSETVRGTIYEDGVYKNIECVPCPDSRCFNLIIVTRKTLGRIRSRKVCMNIWKNKKRCTEAFDNLKKCYKIPFKQQGRDNLSYSVTCGLCHTIFQPTIAEINHRRDDDNYTIESTVICPKHCGKSVIVQKFPICIEIFDGLVIPSITGRILFFL
jgi:hypothetical protein